MARAPKKGRVGAETFLFWGLGLFVFGTAAAALVAVGQCAASRLKEPELPASTAPAPGTAEAAAEVARLYYTSILGKDYPSALLVSEGEAQKRVMSLVNERDALRQQDPVLAGIVGEVMTVEVLSFELESVHPDPGGTSATVQARARIRVAGDHEEHTKNPFFRLVLRQGRWVVTEYEPHRAE